MAKTLHYNFLTNPTLTGSEHPIATSPDLSITRATKATVVKSDGLIHEVSAGVARFTGATYSGDTASGTSTKGLLVEEARTQQAIWTEDISSAAWVASNITKGTTSVTAPDGASNSNVRLTASAANGTLLQTLTSASATRVYSVYMKRVTGTGNIDLTLDGGSTWTTQTLTSEWQRFYITQAAVTNPSFGVRIVTSGDAIDFWGSELNSGATFPTSYISNNSATASVTRNAEAVSATITTEYNNGGPGSIYFAARPLTTSTNLSQDGNAISFRESTTIRVQAYQENTSANQARAQVSPAVGNSGLVIVASAYSANVESKHAIGIEENNLDYYVDGTAATTDTTVSYPTGIDNLFVGSGNGGSTFFNGHIAEIAYFNERLANAALEDYSLNGLPTAFPGTVVGDGGHIWPARSNDPRWAQIITDSGITPSGNFIDDVHAALEAMASTTGAMDDLWKKVKAVYSITDTSEPFTY